MYPSGYEFHYVFIHHQGMNCPDGNTYYPQSINNTLRMCTSPESKVDILIISGLPCLPGDWFRDMDSNEKDLYFLFCFVIIYLNSI